MTTIDFLKHVSAIQTGPFGSQLHASDYVLEGVPCIMPTNIGENRIVEMGIARTTLEHVERLSRHRVRLGDIIYSRRGDVTKRAYITTKEVGWLCGTGCLLVRPDQEKIDAKYLSYFLGLPHVKEYLIRRAVGATMPNLNTGILGDIEINYPPLPEQRQIAAILSSLDDKIDLNRRMNQTLEQLAQTLFQKWFVTFDFPNANGQPYRSSGGELVESELGEMPVGWQVGKLSDVASVNAKTLNPKKAPDFIRYIDIASVSTGKIEEVTKLLFEEAPSRARRIIKNGDVVWSTVRPNRRAFFLALNIEPNTIASTGFAVMSPNEVPFSFLYLLTTTEEFTSYLVNNATGSTYPAVNSSVFAGAKLVIPEEVVLARFHSIVSPLLKRINQNDTQSQILATLRDTLLPQLLTGRLTVRQAEEQFA